VYRITPLDPDVVRQGFCSGVVPLDRYFRERVSQDVRRRITSCFVALSPDGRIAGFYTLAAASVMLTDLPEPLARKLPRYPTVPAIRMGRLAVDRAARNRGLGAALLADALSRSIDSGVAAFALVVDAKDEAATAFYRYHGFVPLADSPRTLFLPLATARMIRR
jgi:ribosomal protein S18 acetylase RimI-like enzyme